MIKKWEEGLDSFTSEIEGLAVAKQQAERRLDRVFLSYSFIITFPSMLCLVNTIVLRLSTVPCLLSTTTLLSMAPVPYLNSKKRKIFAAFFTNIFYVKIFEKFF